MHTKLLLLLFLLVSNINLVGQEQTIGLFQNDSLSVNGYTLWTVGKGTYLIDNCGYLVHNWEHNFDAGLSVYLLENGNLLRTGRVGNTFNGGGSGGLIEEYNWEGELLWTYTISSDEARQHHDIEPLPNGNILAISWELRSEIEAQALGSLNTRSYWPEAIFELEKVGDNEANIVWEWHAWDHLIQDTDPEKPNYGIISEHPELMDINYSPPVGNGPNGGGDWLHFNGIDYDPIRDEIIISSRNMNEIWIIDHSTTTEEAASHSGGARGKGGDILYRWGNPIAYSMEGPQVLFSQHDARIVHEGFPNAGSITVYNNGTARPEGNYSTIDMITPPRDADGNYLLNAEGIFGPEELTWQYVADPPTSFFSNNRSGAHILPNGNTLICEDNKGRFFEVTKEGEIVWDYQNTVTRNGPLTQGNVNGNQMTAIFRVTKYLPDYPAFDGKDLTPGDPIEINPIEYECTIFEEATVSTDGLEVSNSIGALINNIGEVLAIRNVKSDLLKADIYSMDARLLKRVNCSKGETEINLSLHPSGMYILHLYTEDHKAFETYKFIKI